MFPSSAFNYLRHLCTRCPCFFNILVVGKVLANFHWKEPFCRSTQQLTNSNKNNSWKRKKKTQTNKPNPFHARDLVRTLLLKFLAGNVWTQIKHGGQRTVYTLLKGVAKRSIESRLPGARKREINGMFSWCYCRWMLSFPGSFPCVTRSRKRI